VQPKAWNNGRHHQSGAGYGLKVSAEDRDRYFERAWSEIVLDIPGRGSTTVPVSESFWRECTELRTAELGRWLRDAGRAPWPRGEPPTVRLEHVAGNQFQITSDCA
jgi:hypothetical protein